MADFNAIRFLAGRPLTRELGSERLNTILTEIKRNKPKGERGITVRQDGTGTYIGLAAAMPKGGGTPATTHPFQITSSVDPDSDQENPSYLVTVRPGTINSVLPTNWDEEFDLSGDAVHYVVLTVQATSNRIESCELVLQSSPPDGEQEPVAWGLPTEFSVLLGLVSKSTAWQIVYTNLSYTSSKRFVTEKETVEVGKLPYDNYYIWQSVML